MTPLAAYKPTMGRESLYHQRMLELAKRADCCARSTVDPGHFTASAFILSPDKGAVLLIEHSKLHRWLQPGGHVDPADAGTLPSPAGLVWPVKSGPPPSSAKKHIRSSEPQQPRSHYLMGALQAAARREVLEETGLAELELLASPFDLDIHSIPARRDEPAHEHFDVRFLYRSLQDDAVAGSDALAVRWVPLAEVPALKTDDSVWRAMGKLDPYL